MTEEATKKERIGTQFHVTCPYLHKNDHRKASRLWGRGGGLREGWSMPWDPPSFQSFSVVAIDPFHLNLHACAMDWHAQFSRSRGNVSAGLLAECTAVFPWY